MSLSDQVYLCDIFGSARESASDFKIDTLADIIEGSLAIQENTVDQLLVHDHAIFLFMGAGDVQKFQVVFEKMLNPFLD